MNNQELFIQSKKFVPGGVHSPVRSFKGLHQTPVFFKEAKGAYFKDVEGKDYIDFCMSFGPLILGHRNPLVEEKLTEALSRGWSYGACEPYSLELAEYLLSRLPFAEQIRFVNSGTEAVMTALRLARGYTGKNKILKFNGCYHGHVDSMLIKAGSGLAGTAEASSKGISEQTAQDSLVLELGDLDGLKEVLEQDQNVAAVIIEPLPANNGLLPQPKEFLQNVRELTEKHNVLLIFDEVISGFRLGFGGATEKYGITPDLMTYGRVIGGGLPVGAVAGPQKIMSTLAPEGPVYQAGTLSANPLAMVGGLETLKQLDESNYKTLETYAKNIVATLQDWFDRGPHSEFKELTITQEDSLFWIHPGKDSFKRVCDVPSNIGETFYTLFKVLLEKGIYLAPNAYEVGFVSLAHDEKVQEDLKNRLWS